uniref:EGF-like calcium-binding domain-containing protein n=1 Tax=Trichogramma kaykai TaxID=54128 RepID=A0ABD2WAW8_9HYME
MERENNRSTTGTQQSLVDPSSATGLDDINECLEPDSCSQVCKNTIGGFECSCVSGYLRDPKNDRRCKAIEGHASLLLSKRNDIRKIALDRKEMTLLVNNTKFAVAIDFMFQTGMLFWSDVQAKKIFKAPIDESNEKMLIISDNVTITDGLAIDWIHHFIFWTSSMGHAIKLATLDGSMIKTVVRENILEPRAIALDPIEGWMFWTDWGHNATIERAALGGTYRSVSYAK